MFKFLILFIIQSCVTSPKKPIPSREAVPAEILKCSNLEIMLSKEECSPFSVSYCAAHFRFLHASEILKNNDEPDGASIRAGDDYLKMIVNEKCQKSYQLATCEQMNECAEREINLLAQAKVPFFQKIDQCIVNYKKSVFIEGTQKNFELYNCKSVLEKIRK